MNHSWSFTWFEHFKISFIQRQSLCKFWKTWRGNGRKCSRKEFNKQILWVHVPLPQNKKHVSRTLRPLPTDSLSQRRKDTIPNDFTKRFFSRHHIIYQYCAGYPQAFYGWSLSLTGKKNNSADKEAIKKSYFDLDPWSNKISSRSRHIFYPIALIRVYISV